MPPIIAPVDAAGHHVLPGEPQARDARARPQPALLHALPGRGRARTARRGRSRRNAASTAASTLPSSRCGRAPAAPCRTGARAAARRTTASAPRSRRRACPRCCRAHGAKISSTAPARRSRSWRGPGGALERRILGRGKRHVHDRESVLRVLQEAVERAVVVVAARVDPVVGLRQAQFLRRCPAGRCRRRGGRCSASPSAAARRSRASRATSARHQLREGVDRARVEITQRALDLVAVRHAHAAHPAVAHQDLLDAARR